MADHRLGDVIDDYCIKCRRLTNHSIVSILTGEAAKVRCRTCYHDHDYRHEIAPPSKKDLKKAELFAEVLAASGAPSAVADPAEAPAVSEDAADQADAAPDAAPDTAHLATVEGGAEGETGDGASREKKGRKTARK